MDIVFILVEPSEPANIGAAARAVKTMGFTKLRLVNPSQYPSEKAEWLAHGSKDILDSAQRYYTFEEATRDIDFLVACTARKRSVKADYYTASDLPVFLKNKMNIIRSTGLVFGKEESGLDNETIGRCDIAATIPMIASFPSLNLSQAVMVFAYELSELSLKAQDGEQTNPDGAVYLHFKRLLENLLNRLEIDRNPNLYHRIMERASSMSGDDIGLTMSILNRLKYPGLED